MTTRPLYSAIVFGLMLLGGLWFLFFAPKTSAIGQDDVTQLELISIDVDDIRDPYTALEYAYAQIPPDFNMIGQTYLTALKLYDDGYFELSSSLLAVMAGNGHIESLILLADHYRRGAGVEKDVAVSVTLLQAAVDQGSATAAYALGNLLDQGDEGVPRDREQARELWTFAAQKGYQPAILKLNRR